MTVFDSNIQYINANELNDLPKVISQYVYGEYELNTTLIKQGSEGQASIANDYLTSSHIVINNGKMKMKLKFRSANMFKQVSSTFDGKIYATLTFTGMDHMKNHKIYINGSKVIHQVVAKSSNSISIRFDIPNVDANITIELLVILMGAGSLVAVLSGLLNRKKRK